MLVLFLALASLLWIVKPRNQEISYDDLFILTEGQESEIAINTKKYAEILQAELFQASPLEDKLYALKYLLAIYSGTSVDLIPSAEQLPQLKDEEYQVLKAYSQALLAPSAPQDNSSPAELLALAQRDPPLPYANYALSLFYSSTANTEKAIAAAKSEIAAYPSSASRLLLVDILSVHQRYEEIEELLADPEFEPLVDSFLRRDIALTRMDWPVLIKTLLPIAYEDTSLAMALLALLTGACWTALLLRFSGKLSWSIPVVWLTIPALLLGALSAHLTILAIYLQEEQLGLSRGNEIIGQAIYCFAGIGLREELLKLLCFIPLIPFLIKRKNELEILVVASLVGLGFAVEENISYFEQSQGIAAIGRFITANFFHLSLTGLCGLTLTQAIIFRGSAINTAVSTFGIAVLAHGAYDAFIIIPELGEYSFATIIVFILISYQYFSWIRHLRPVWNDPISISAQFTFSLVLIFGASYLLLSWERGPFESIAPLTEEVLGLAILLVMFYREIPEEVI